MMRNVRFETGSHNCESCASCQTLPRRSCFNPHDRVAQNLAFDQLMTAYPEVDEPFEDKRDVLNRLLSYHIYQHPRQELDALRGSKGKGKVTELDLLKEETEGMLLILPLALPLYCLCFGLTCANFLPQ